MTTGLSAPQFLPWLAPAAWHHLFEVLAFLAAGQLAWRRGARHAPDLADRGRRLIVLAGAVAGAGLGARFLHVLEFAGAATDAPAAALLGGKSLVGGLLGAIAGVEIAKRLVGIRTATGDAFVLPLTAGVAIGRLGCFAAGLADGTYGVPTALPWGVDFGDGVPRHPTQLYEALFVAAVGVTLARWRAPALRAGDRFRLWVLAYLAFRLGVEWLKPPFGPAAAIGDLLPLAATRYAGDLTAIQIACLAGIAVYAPAGWRIVRAGRRTARGGTTSRPSGPLPPTAS